MGERQPIVDAPGYFVDAEGRVWSTRAWRGYREGHMRELLGTINAQGYRNVGLARANKYMTCTVHALVAHAFLGPKPEWHEEIRHLDGNKLNNRASNLSWGTVVQNQADSARHGTQVRGERSNLARLTEATVRAILEEMRAGGYAPEVALKHGVSRQTAYRIGAGLTWAHITRRAA